MINQVENPPPGDVAVVGESSESDYYLSYIVNPVDGKVKPVTDRATKSFAFSEAKFEADLVGWQWQTLRCRNVPDGAKRYALFLLQEETVESILAALKIRGIEVVEFWHSGSTL